MSSVNDYKNLEQYKKEQARKLNLERMTVQKQAKRQLTPESFHMHETFDALARQKMQSFGLSYKEAALEVAREREDLSDGLFVKPLDQKEPQPRKTVQEQVEEDPKVQRANALAKEKGISVKKAQQLDKQEHPGDYLEYDLPNQKKAW